MKLCNAQLPRKSRETIRCSAASSILWNYPMLSYLASLVKLSDAQLPRQFCELFNAQVPRQFLETTRCSTASSNLVKLSDAQLPHQSRETIRSWTKRASATKSTLQRHNYSQKWNCKASFPIPTFMYLWAIYIFPFPTIGLHILLQQNRWTVIIWERSNMKRNLIKMVKIRMNTMF